MTSKERILRKYAFQPVDRFTIHFCAEAKVYPAMREYYGVPDDPRSHKPYGGFTIAPSQDLISDIPAANIAAMYKAAYEFGSLAQPATVRS